MFHFVTRDALWLIVCLVTSTGWLLDHAQHQHIRHMLREHHPMLYETATGEQINTNNLDPETLKTLMEAAKEPAP